MARRKTPVPIPHEPTGDFRRPPMLPSVACRCGAAIRRVSNEATHPAHLDWTYVDEEGRSYTPVDWTFTTTDGRQGDLAEAAGWDLLAEVDIARYSALRAAFSLGAVSYTHGHYPATIGDLPMAEWPPPECHGWPMWAAPDGWRCRTTYGEPALVPYSEPGEAVA